MGVASNYNEHIKTTMYGTRRCVRWLLRTLLDVLVEQEQEARLSR